MTVSGNIRSLSENPEYQHTLVISPHCPGVTINHACIGFGMFHDIS